MKAIIYCRKSTDREDMQVQSLDDQRKWCEETAKSLDYNVVEIISESISGKNPETRPGFKKMLKLLEEGKADRVIVWKCNRLARNPIDQSYIEWYLQEGIINEIVSSDGVFRHGDNVLIVRMYFGMATQYVVDLKKDVLRGMRSKVEKGGIVAKPPRGYSIEDGMAVQNDDARAIRDIFDLRTKGWAMHDIAQEMYARYGLDTRNKKPVMHTYIDKLLKNPFYYGAIQWAGELFNGNHEPIVSKEVWDKVNGISRGVSYEKHSDNPVFRLRGIVRDSETGAILTASLIKGKYTYFHTSTRDKRKIYINQQAILDWFDANIGLFVIPKPFEKQIKQAFRDALKGKQDDTNMIRKKLQKKEKELTMKKQGLVDLRLSGELTQEEFLEQKNRIVSELQEVKSNLLDTDALDENILDAADTIIIFYTNLVSVWKSADLGLKIDIVKILMENLFVGEEKMPIFKFYPLWEAVYEANKNPAKYEVSDGMTEWLPGADSNRRPIG